MEEAVKDYNQAFQGPIPDASVPGQCEEFVQIILAQEPDRTQLYFCSGLINFYAKQDFLAAERDFNLFLTNHKGSEFSRQAAEARKLIEDCKSKTQSLGKIN